MTTSEIIEMSQEINARVIYEWANEYMKRIIENTKTVKDESVTKTKGGK
jgi:hypothetical protein